MAELIIARELALPGAYGLEVQRSERCWSFFHEAYCVTVVSAGSGRWRYRKRDASIAPASLMLMEPGEVHVTTAVESPGSFHALFFRPELVRDVVEAVRPREPHLRVLATAAPEIVQGFQRACSALQAGADEEAQREEFSLALTRLFEHSSETPGRLSVAPTTRVRKAARLLRERYESAPDKTVNITEVAAEVGMNYHWLVHSFTEEYGIPPYKYVQAVRLAKVRSLLLQGPRHGVRCLNDIATVVGFCDKSHLHRSFSRQYGISPWQLALALNAGWRSA